MNYANLFIKAKLTVVFVWLTFAGICQEDDSPFLPKFQNLNFEDGISNLSVQSIEQDEQGYMWMATARGLNRYDGISFEHFLFDENNEYSLYHNGTYNLHKNFNGQLFCATSLGVNMFDPKVKKMYRIKSNNERFADFIDFEGITYGTSLFGGLFEYTPEQKAFNRLTQFDSNIVVGKLTTDKQTGIWGKTTDNKYLVNFNPQTNILKKYAIPDGDVSNLEGDILKIGNTILVASKTIKAFNLSSLQFESLPAKYKQLKKLQECVFTFIKNFDNNLLWIGTGTQGLYIFDTEANRLTNITKENSTLKTNNLTTIFEDRDNNIWLGTFDQGVNVAFQHQNNINFETELEKLTANKFVTCVTTDNKLNYFVGTRADGLLLYHGGEIKKGKFWNTKNSRLESNHIRTVFIDSKNQLWVGSVNGLFLSDLKFKNVKKIELPLPNNGVVSFCEQDGKILAGTDIQGFFTFDYKGNVLSQNLEFGNNIAKIIPSGEQEILFSSYPSGLFSYNINTKQHKNLLEIIPGKDHKPIEIITMYLDKDSTLWMGSFNNGLYQYSYSNNTFTNFTKKDGLPNNDVVCIQEDNNGKLWIGTSYGLSRFDKKEEFVNYFQNEGIQNLQFHQKASTIDFNGVLFFGGNNGLTFFDPGAFNEIDYKRKPTTILKSISVLNREVKPNDATQLISQVLNNTKEITLNHKQKVFTIEYHAFDYMAADKIKYSYFLEGFDTEWNNVGTRTHANFSNLNSGEYMFKVKAQTNSGTWSDISSLKITIKPSPFNTVLAYFIYVLLIAFIVYISFKLTLNAKLYKSKLELEHNERVRENEIAQMKMRFFTNISHEIRTPLTLIKGNADILSKDLEKKQIQFDSFKGLQHSTNRLLALVNQLLSFRSLENDALHLKIKNDDLISITQKLIQSFQYVAVNRNISIQVITEFDKLILPIDDDKYEKIISNLLSNSLKHARENGKISIKISMLEIPEYEEYFNNTTKIADTSLVKIAVIDDGIGIPKKDLPHVFDRFQQSETDKNKPDYSGTGIGLNYTKRLVELHRGAIIAKSKPNVETEFSFVLSLDAHTYEKDIWVNENKVLKADLNTESSELDTARNPNKNLPLLLVVEDDLELNRFISTSLKTNYRVISCYNGNEGLKLAKNQLPDVIISDIMMPEVDGLELCKRVRKDKLISHIPIILLTAKTDEESEITGLKYGADDYISKPFKVSLLKARINNLIALRIQLQQSYKQGILEEPEKVITNQFELNFIKKIDAIVSEEYQSQKLNVNFLAEQMNMSRTNFYRKFVSIMDISPKDFITKYRINKAIQLIINGKENFGEISFLCGFGSQSNFSVLFKKEKGITPLQFRKSL